MGSNAGLAVQRGVVDWYSKERGYGFIIHKRVDNVIESVFIHHTKLPGKCDLCLAEGDEVTFTKYYLDDDPTKPRVHEVYEITKTLKELI